MYEADAYTNVLYISERVDLNLLILPLHPMLDGRFHSYTNKPDLVACLRRLWESNGGEGDGKCNKLFIGRPSRSTSGVEGLFSTDGVMHAHIFQILAESPADVVDVLHHLRVSYAVTCLRQASAQRSRHYLTGRYKSGILSDRS